jgi:uncharacterized protein
MDPPRAAEAYTDLMQDMLPIHTALHSIESYGKGGFTIRGTLYAHAVHVSAHSVLPWHAQDVADWDSRTLSRLPTAAPPPELVLIGTGATHQFVAPEVKHALKPYGIAVETMDTGAACRSYNILLSEGRRVAAILLLPI